MQRNRARVSFYLFLIVLISLTNSILDSKADVASVKYSGTGSFFPAENCPLIMTNASVLFDINYNEPSNIIDISFEGNYTIYNPNVSQNITVAAPFSSEFKNLESTCIIKVENDQKPFTFYQYHWSDPWAEYLDTVEFGSLYSFVLTNITIVENSSVQIEYSFNAYMIPSIDDDQIRISYNVGTSRAWNGSITERVELNTHGKLPNSFSSEPPYFDDYDFTLMNFSDSRSYTWEWIDETININTVYISYSFPHHRFIRMLRFFIILSLYIGVPLIIAVIFRRIKRKRTEKKINDTFLKFKE
ncbi:MAG: hypothetical protein JSV62_03510 [Promethearchaeota archaeon]|nr:MAG: hypothetical protein JSV62_03510 [Candidatus Lokiarchaeota archaeon]